MKIELLLTGDELMTGDVIDSNSAMVADKLMACGWELTRKTTVGDKLEQLIAELQRLSQAADVLIMNGGLGPTSDDYTAQALAAAAGKPLQMHPLAMKHVEQWCAQRGFTMTEASQKQALLPAGCEIVANPVGSAVGFCLTLHQCLVICTPGVPVELASMLEESVVPLLREQYQRWCNAQDVSEMAPVAVKKLQVFGLGEAAIQTRIHKLLPDWPAHIVLGYRASPTLVDVKLTTHSLLAQHEVPYWCGRLRDILDAHVIGEDDATLESTLVSALAARSMKMVTAESCTGGRIAASITRIAGASQVFDAGLVTYSNAMKVRVLGVSPQTLETHGAVSEAVVQEMLTGALDASGADVGVAVSGIAGPEGGSPDKPVGLVWLAWGSHKLMQTAALYYPGGRDLFQTRVTSVALDLLRRFTLGIEASPCYLHDRKFNSGPG
ncbi:MAG: CinA family nicotinamide mononucleotide deamidase-related protein [Hahellaceae bacterium]|nr:CinA family nicotinamide mononucleotide deamidase-related protein [Hahellaceae bacterium]